MRFAWVLLLVLDLFPTAALAQQNPGGELSAKNAYDIGVDFGTLLPSRIGLLEMVPGWGFRVGLPTGKGVFEPNVFTGIGNGIIYRSFSIDYRLDLNIEGIGAHFLLGMHADQFDQASPPVSNKFAGGWHYGGGISQQIAGPAFARFDFRHRFSPGQVVEITVGFTYRFAAGGGG